MMPNLIKEVVLKPIILHLRVRRTPTSNDEISVCGRTKDQLRLESEAKDEYHLWVGIGGYPYELKTMIHPDEKKCPECYDHPDLPLYILANVFTDD